jgi:hypothetical protein
MDVFTVQVPSRLLPAPVDAADAALAAADGLETTGPAAPGLVNEAGADDAGADDAAIDAGGRAARLTGAGPAGRRNRYQPP